LHEDGSYLFRSKGSSTTEYILSVVYKGAPTHHALVRADDGEEFSLNKQPTGTYTLDELVEKYASKQPKWPVALTSGVPNEAEAGGGGGGGGGDAKGSGGGEHAGNDNPDTDWLHEKIKKADADALLLADGGAGNSGKFLIRRKGASQHEFVLGVIYKGAPTHHTLVRKRRLPCVVFVV
jgi:hypothetical protein